MRSRTSKSLLTIGRAFGTLWLLALAGCGGSGASYTPAQIELVMPATGPSTGGTMLRITGTNFAEGDIVTIGGQLAPGSVFVSPTELAVPLPSNPGAFGRAAVTVTHRDEQTTSRNDLFSYYLGNLQLASRTVGAGAGRPYSVRIADLNADGIPDALTGNIGDGKLSVLLGVSGGGFLPPRNFVAGQQPVDIAVADINGDGKLDVAVADFASRRINVLLGDGQGTFPTGYTSAVSGAPLSLAVGDLNSDGKLDVLVSTDIPNITPMLGDGVGRFTGAAPADTGANPVKVLLADVSGDGKLDALTANLTDNNVTVRLGNGAAAFATVSTYGVGKQPNALALGDALAN